MTKTTIAQHKEFTMANLCQWALDLLPRGEVEADPDRVEYLIGRAVQWVLPVGAEWDEETGEVYFEYEDDEVTSLVKLNLEAMAYVVIGAVTSPPWSRPRSAPGYVDGQVNTRIVFGWNVFEQQVHEDIVLGGLDFDPEAGDGHG